MTAFPPIPDPDETESDLWFLPGPFDDDDEYRPVPKTAPAHSESRLTLDWVQAQAACAAQLAHLAGRLGALDDRLARGPNGWRHRLALIEGADLSWITGDRVSPDRLALWMALRLSGVQQDMDVLARAGWAVRRLSGGPGPMDDLAAFLDRRDPQALEHESEPFAERAEAWQDVLRNASDLHPIVRACMGFQLWTMAGLGTRRIESIVVALRIAADDGRGAVFAPLAMGGSREALAALRVDGAATDKLRRWLDALAAGCQAAMRHLDDLENWDNRAATVMASLSGKTPPALRGVLAEWPLVSAPMAETLSGASRAAVQRNLAWMEEQGLIAEVTKQGRFRMWQIASPRKKTS